MYAGRRCEIKNDTGVVSLGDSNGKNLEVKRIWEELNVSLLS